MMTGDRYLPALNRGLRVFFSEFVRVSLSRPGQALFFLKVLRWQRQAARRRARRAAAGLHVPPIVIFSITDRCNLHCQGCYQQAIRRADGGARPTSSARRSCATSSPRRTRSASPSSSSPAGSR